MGNSSLPKWEMTGLENSKNVSEMPRIKKVMKHVSWKEFLCGCGAGFTNICVLYPMNKLLYRQMMYGTNALQAAVRLKKEGLFFLYRGILPPLCQKALTMSLMFGVYGDVRERLLQSGVNPYLAKAIGGVSAAVSESVLHPFQRIQALLSDYKYNYEFKNMFHIAREIRMKYGFFEYYRGYVPFLLRHCPTNILFFTLREEVQKRIPYIQSTFIRSICEFTYGAVLGCVLSCLFYPITVGKLTMQRNLGTPFENLYVVLKRIYHKRGGKLRYIYYGVPTNILRAFMSWGILNLSYETYKSIIY